MAYNAVSRPSTSRLLDKLKARPGLLFGLMIVSALIFFEMFNYSTTDYALRDLLGGLKFLGLPWATILAIAFCGIDFAGIARLFTPQTGSAEPKEIWYLFGAWLLAATMNALLTWWGVSMAIANHSLLSTAVVSATTLTRVVPIFVALMVWVIRILIIGTISQAGERIFSSQSRHAYSRPASQAPTMSTGTARPAFTGSQRPGLAGAQRPDLAGARSAQPRQPCRDPPARFRQPATSPTWPVVRSRPTTASRQRHVRSLVVPPPMKTDNSRWDPTQNTKSLSI